jgi:phage minor tail protein G
MFLKSEPFEHNGHIVTLYELSALHRLEHLQRIAEEEEKLPEGIEGEELYRHLIARNIRLGARVVAMSLWQADTSGPDVNALYQQVMSCWPLEMIGAADQMVKKLSDMIPPEPEKGEGDNETEEKQEEITAEKPTPAS